MNSEGSSERRERVKREVEALRRLGRDASRPLLEQHIDSLLYEIETEGGNPELARAWDTMSDLGIALSQKRGQHESQRREIGWLRRENAKLRRRIERAERVASDEPAPTFAKTPAEPLTPEEVERRDELVRARARYNRLRRRIIKLAVACGLVAVWVTTPQPFRAIAFVALLVWGVIELAAAVADSRPQWIKDMEDS